MFNISTTAIMLGLDLLMIIYTLWALSIFKPIGKSGKLGKLGLGIGLGMLAWLGVLHLGLSSESLFAKDISGIAFLIIIFAGVGLVGALLFVVPSLRKLLLGLDQRQLMLLQGVRAFFGGTFLMFASLGVLPQGFGIIDGFTHIGAGFFGLIAAFSVAAGVDGNRRAWFANIFGLTDILIVASTLALILLPKIGPHHGMMYAVFLPAPLWLWFHLVSIWKLVRGEAAGQGE